MDTKFCKNCGQANFPEAVKCAKCGGNLAGGFETEGQSSSAATKSGDNKLYWILGGIGVVVLLGGFFVVALAAGIYIYTGQDETAYEKPNTAPDSNAKTEEKPPSEKDEDKPTTVGRLENENLESFIRDKYQQVGAFKLQSVKDIEARSKKIFRRSNDEAFAIYSSDEKNPLEILFSIANFKKISDAKIDVAAIKIKTLAKKGKILSEEKLPDGVIISFQEKSLVGILDCKNKVCARILGADSQKVTDFYKKVAFK